jgi:hypothetical protein
LVDSNLDWGQELPGLKRWLVKNAGNQPVWLSYFGTGSPAYYGIEATRLPTSIQQRHSLRGGIYCISATDLSAVYLKGRWSAPYERVYQALDAFLDQVQTAQEQGTPLPPIDPYVAALLHDHPSILDEYPNLQQTRLMAYLRHRQPDDHIGYSMLIFRLSDAEVQHALHGPPAELDEISRAEREGFVPPQ